MLSTTIPLPPFTRFVRVLAGLSLLALASVAPLARGQAWQAREPQPGDFVLSAENGSTALVVEPTADSAVTRAVNDLAADFERVTDRRPAVVGAPDGLDQAIVVGVIGHSRLVDDLVARKKLVAAGLAGSWESFVIAVVEAPWPGVSRALVVAGSDRRGAIYGTYEISSAIGVSPWYWWADVPVPKRPRLGLAAGTYRFGPPSVKYRGVFLNDEDWGLQPWAAKTFEPETRDIGPRTYAKLFELLLRLKANTVWPAMHPTTRAFNHYPQNKEVADAYGIVMGSSHAEPMLRNNVDEWTAPKEDYNYVTNRDGVLRYWEQRVEENGRYENIYTLGMRGIHDSNMQGPKTDAERIRVLEQIFADQRALLAKHVRPEVEQVPQMFCAYKEVLELYRQGLRVPEDVTVVWPDDNFGFIRNFAPPEERTRSGGFGVYYHLSYLGRPLSYLWLSTMPPALIWEEMHKAYEHGADRIWIANVGDLKPAEIPVEFFLQMAWDVKRWRPDNLPQFLVEWSARTFGATHAEEIAAVLAEYYLLNFQRKPEHLQWWLPRQPYRPSTLTDEEVNARLAAFARLEAKAETLRTKVGEAQRDAFYQLVYYPVVGAALANQRFFTAERGEADVARAADARLTAETVTFNRDLAGGKWRGIMTLEPADAQWASMRIAPWAPPETARQPVPTPRAGTFFAVRASRAVQQAPGEEGAWTKIPGLGRTGEALTVLPTTAPLLGLDQAAKAPRLDFEVTVPAAGTFKADVHLLPTHPLRGTALRLAISVGDDAPQLVTLEVDDGGQGWAQGVLNAVRVASTQLRFGSAGAHTVRVYGLEPGVVFEKLVIDFGGLTPTYLGPDASP